MQNKGLIFILPLFVEITCSSYLLTFCNITQYNKTHRHIHRTCIHSLVHIQMHQHTWTIESNHRLMLHADERIKDYACTRSLSRPCLLTVALLLLHGCVLMCCVCRRTFHPFRPYACYFYSNFCKFQ